MSKPDTDQYQRIDNSQADPAGISGAVSSAAGGDHELTSISPSAPHDDTHSTNTTAGGGGEGQPAVTTAAAGAGDATTNGAAPTSMRVNVRTLTGQQIECDLPANAQNTVADIKAKVEELQGMNSSCFEYGSTLHVPSFIALHCDVM